MSAETRDFAVATCVDVKHESHDVKTFSWRFDLSEAGDFTGTACGFA